MHHGQEPHRCLAPAPDRPPCGRRIGRPFNDDRKHRGTALPDQEADPFFERHDVSRRALNTALSKHAQRAPLLKMPQRLTQTPRISLAAIDKDDASQLPQRLQPPHPHVRRHHPPHFKRQPRLNENRVDPRRVIRHHDERRTVPRRQPERITPLPAQRHTLLALITHAMHHPRIHAKHRHHDASPHTVNAHTVTPRNHDNRHGRQPQARCADQYHLDDFWNPFHARTR